MNNGLYQTLFPVADYDLRATLNCGQAFRWEECQGGWSGVIGQRWVRLRSSASALVAETVEPLRDAAEISACLQTHIHLPDVLATFPDDPHLRAATRECHGLRLLRQDPWECLASFILSSTKQIVQIRQIIALLCERFGERVAVPGGEPPTCAFPSAERLGKLSEAELRACKMGFRAPYLLATARAVAEGRIDLNRLGRLPLNDARAALMSLPGVGRKIADCVLLFAYGFPTAFPIDVWVLKGLRQLYFPRRKSTLRALHEFSASYFGPHAGYAQQYLFHYLRLNSPRAARAIGPSQHTGPSTRTSSCPEPSKSFSAPRNSPPCPVVI